LLWEKKKRKQHVLVCIVIVVANVVVIAIGIAIITHPTVFFEIRIKNDVGVYALGEKK